MIVVRRLVIDHVHVSAQLVNKDAVVIRCEVKAVLIIKGKSFIVINSPMSRQFLSLYLE